MSPQNRMLMKAVYRRSQAEIELALRHNLSPLHGEGSGERPFWRVIASLRAHAQAVVELEGR
jgi:hypothetical protein